MIKIENVDVYGFEAAIRGMRNPKNSWDKSDSSFIYDVVGDLYDNEHTRPELGENDLKLAKTLANAGADHGKFLRMIGVSFDITAPLYWVAEHDTYKVGTVRNSCSFMHKGTSKPFELCDFSHAPENEGMLLEVIEMLNRLRESYLLTKDDSIFIQIRQLLPQGYNIKYTWSANYAVLRNIYHSRRTHRLPEWREFCRWIESLPYSELITGGESNEKQ